MKPDHIATFRIRPNLGSFVLLSAVFGACAGVVMAMVGAIKLAVAGELLWTLVPFVIFPVCYGIGSAILGVLSFPVFSAYCKRFGPPEITGRFIPVASAENAAEATASNVASTANGKELM